MKYIEKPQTKNKVIIEKINDEGKGEFIGYWDPEKIIHITSKREVAEFLIVEKKAKLINTIIGSENKIYFVLILEK